MINFDKRIMAKKATGKKKKKPAAKKPKIAAKARSNGALANAVVEGIKEKKGGQIVILDLRDVPNSVSDFFIICHGNSRTHVQAVAGSVEEEVHKKTGMKPWHSEGYENSEWILVDYGSVVAHIFRDETRSFYNLEALWADALITRIGT